MGQSVDIEPRGGGSAFLKAGQHIRVSDVEGGQVADLFAFVDGGHGEHLSAQHTRAMSDRLFPKPGGCFYSNRRRPVLRFLEDDSPGVHDMLIAACDPDRYRLLGVEGHHASCAENLRVQMNAVGLDSDFVPQPVNLFMQIPVLADGSLEWAPALTSPGASVTLQAELDTWVIVSACPQDIVVINNNQPSGIRLEIFDSV